jgi:hypothetical protein
MAPLVIRVGAALTLLGSAACKREPLFGIQPTPFIVYCDLQLDFVEPLIANGSDSVRVRARVHDGNGRVLPSRSVEFTAVGDGCVLQPQGLLLTDAAGIAETFLTATLPGQKWVIAHIDRGAVDEARTVSPSVEFLLPLLPAR